MNSNYILDILNSNKWRSILLIGPWGCGKSYLVNEFTKMNTTKSFKYVSLFGIENVTSFLSIIKNSMIPNDFYDIKSPSIIDKSILDFDSNHSDIDDAPIFIFDDIERIDNNIFQLDVFFGIVKKLISLNYRVICICANNKIKLSSSYEKSMDRICYLREPSDDVILKLAGIKNNLNCETIRKITNNNLRILKRTALNFDDIVNKFKDANRKYLDKLGITKESLFIITLCAHAAIEGSDFTNKSDGIKNSFSTLLYARDSNNFGFNIANEFLKIKENKVLTDFEYNLLIELVDYLLTGSELVFQRIKEKSKNSILDLQFTFLSDSKKTLFIKEFINHLNEYDFKVRQNLSMLGDLLKEPLFYTFSDAELTIIADKLYKDYGDSDNINDIFEYRLIKSTIDNNYSNFNRLGQILNKIKLEKNNKLNPDSKRRNYEKMIKKISKIENSSPEVVEDFINELSLKQYEFPCINYSINARIWKYCHSLCKLISKSNDEQIKYFVDFLQRGLQKAKSKSGRYRYTILLKEYFPDYWLNKI